MNPTLIRNVSIVGSDQHGKTTLMNRILGKTKDRNTIMATNVNYFMTIRSNPVSISAKSNVSDNHQEELLFNIIDTPGHPEFLGHVAGDLKLTDGLIVVVDCSEGLFEHIRTILKHALSSTPIESNHHDVGNKDESYKKIVLFINKVDILLKHDAGTDDSFEAIHKTLKKIVSDVNEILKECNHPALDPREGNVIFGSALHGWIIDFDHFIGAYHKQFGVEQSKLLGRFWDDHYFDMNEKKWRKRLKNGDEHRGFNKFILGPIHRTLQQCYSTLSLASLNEHGNGDENNNKCMEYKGDDFDNVEKESNDTKKPRSDAEQQNIDKVLEHIEKVLKISNVGMKPEKVLEQLKQKYRSDTAAAGDALFHLVMRHLMPLESRFIRIIERHLPSPFQDQQHNYYYSQKSDTRNKSTTDIVSEAIYCCDSKGPLVIHVTKYIEIDTTIQEEQPRYRNIMCLGRILSGTLSINSDEDDDAYSKVHVSTDFPLANKVDSIRGILTLGIKQSFYPVTRTSATTTTSTSNNSDNDNVPLSAGCLVLLVMKKQQWSLPAIFTLKDEIDYACPFISSRISIPFASPVIEIPIRVEPHHSIFVYNTLAKLFRMDPSFTFWEESVAPEGGDVQFLISVTGKHHLRTLMALLLILSRQEQQKEQKKQKEEGIKTSISSSPLEINVMEDDKIVCYHETITSTSPQVLAKSPNRYCRMTMHVQQAGTQYYSHKKDNGSSAEGSDNNNISSRNKRKQAARCWGHNTVRHNLLFNDTCGIQYLSEFKDGIVQAFQWVQKEGPLFYGPLNHCQFHIHDIFSNCDAIKRGNGQVIIMTRNSMFGSLVSANMTLEEPIYIVEIICKASVVQHVRDFFLMTNHDGDNDNNSNKHQYQNCVFIGEAEQCHALNAVCITFHLPVKEAMYLDKEEFNNKNPLAKIESLRKTLHHWEKLPGLAHNPDSEVHKIVRELRKRRNLKEDIPTYEKQYEKKT
ncbi:hypothetical protein BDA99DRAFT_516940 [Phascolomyces articulosus]|uniref:Tr-type G domain-containing protein n=1 Tax=Phascolomyces articulosus TaxID=60185 RepID=A0AAD5K6B2_9FUNG|nr:hypothetical protein BDA99DRAFT_516940 [Phascolomyces articulosus]